MSIPFRPITRVKDMLNSIGQEMSYCYEDLVFLDHNAFLLQMGEKGEDLYVHFNRDCPEKERGPLLGKLKDAGAMQDLKVRFRGEYTLAPNEGDKEISIQFFPN